MKGTRKVSTSVSDVEGLPPPDNVRQLIARSGEAPGAPSTRTLRLLALCTACSLLVALCSVAIALLALREARDALVPAAAAPAPAPAPSTTPGSTTARARHEWSATNASIRLQQADGTWGPWIDLQQVAQQPGPRGPPGVPAAPVATQWNGTNLRLAPNDTSAKDGGWGPWVDLQGPRGSVGLDGRAGSDGRDGVNGTDGAQGPQGPQGLQGPRGFNGNNSCELGGMRYLSVRCFGAVGDSTVDDTDAVQAAIDAAAPLGATVELPVGQYKLLRPLRVPAGVVIRGESMGKDPLQMLGWTGSVLMNWHTSYTVVIEGSLAGLRDLAVVDPLHIGQGGILCNGTGRGLESLRFHSVLVFGFTSGTAVDLVADLGGAVTYSTFYDLRVRNAKIGVHMRASGVNHAFVNSNSFYHGAISGGGFHYGILMEGPGADNNNIFVGTIIEPPVTQHGHVVVTGDKSQILAYGIRIEGSTQDLYVPMVRFGPETDGSVITGLYAGGLIDVDLLNHDMQLRSGKAMGADVAPTNVVDNACLLGGTLPHTTPSSDYEVVPYWRVTAANVQVSRLPESEWLMDNYAVLNITVPAGVTAKFYPDSTALSKRAVNKLSRILNVGAYANTDRRNTVFWSITSTGGVTSSAYHPGDGEWSLVSMSGRVEALGVRVAIRPYLWMDNSAGTSGLQVLVSVPMLRFGPHQLIASASEVTSAGGIIAGSLTVGLADAYPPAAGNFWVLPRGNTFRVHSTTAIHRLNDVGTDRFEKGTVVTLLFLEAGLSVADSVYIDLLSAFTSNAGSSLTLLAMDAGTWVELSRNV